LAAAAILEKSPYRQLRRDRYASFDSGEGQQFEQGNLKLVDLFLLAGQYGEPPQRSGKQEMWENIINRFV